MNNYQTSNIEYSLLSSYITYDRLFALSKNTIYKIDNCRFCDIYIDINSILTPIFFSKYIIGNYNCITSSMINLAIHMKQFYRSRFGIDARVFLVYSDNFPYYPRSILEEYNQRNYTSFINNDQLVSFINYNNDLMSTLCPYLYGIYFIKEQQQETAVVIKNIIDKQKLIKNNNYHPNIIISKDLMSYQLVSYEAETFLFRPKKINAEDKSWCVKKSNLYKAIKKQSGGNIDIPQVNYPIDHNLLSLILSISGVKSRNIKAIHTYNKTLDIINEAINNNLIINGINSDIEYTIDKLSTLSEKIKNNKDIIIKRYLSIDIVNNSKIYESSTSSSLNTSGLIDLEDPDTVKEINNNYFQYNPIDLINL